MEIRDSAGRFRPGTPSPNPGGRPKGVAARAREVADLDTLLGVLFGIATDETARNSDRLAACRELLDRAYGRSPAFAPLESSDPLERNELDLAIADIAARLTGRRAWMPEAN